MNQVIEVMLKKYRLNTMEDYEYALHEIIQEVALLGLWRGKFFEHCAFYGGTALRILHGLDRFSEDMDFTLLKTNMEFSLKSFFSHIKMELTSYGFSVSIESKVKKTDSQIDSAFIKANTLSHLMHVGYSGSTQKSRNFKIKIEVDRDPPQQFKIEAKTVLQPIPFSVRTLTLEDLFAGKMHALLYRQWKQRIKGRDWYDFVWYVSRDIPVHLAHLVERTRQSQNKDKDWHFSEEKVRDILNKKIADLDIELAKRDVRPFLNDLGCIEIWSQDFFYELADKLRFQ